MSQMIQLLQAQRSRTEQLEKDKSRLQDMLDHSGGNEDTMGRQKTDLNQARREVEQAVMRISELTAELETREARFQQRLDSEHQNTETINAHLAAAHREAGTAWSKNTELSTELEFREQRMAALTAEIEKLKARNYQLENRQHNHQQDVHDIIGAQQKGLASAVREIERARMNISALTVGMNPSATPGASPGRSPLKDQISSNIKQLMATPTQQTGPLLAEEGHGRVGSPKGADAADVAAMDRMRPAKSTGQCCWMQ